LFRLGCQVSIVGKIYDAVDRAVSLGCNTFQIFARNPRQFRRSCIPKEDIDRFKEKVNKNKISPVIIHIPYTLNLASSREKFYRITIKEFIEDLIEADKLGADYLITHMGSYKGFKKEISGLKRITKAISKILKETEGTKTILLLENTSGSGSWLGYKFSHQKFIFEGLNYNNRLGLCLDTAHAWAGGYKINDKDGLESLLYEIENLIGLDRLFVIHLNDTKEPFNSRNDRHIDIGKGNIGEKGFSLIVNHPKLKNLAFILETPKKSEEDDLRNLNTVRRLYYDKLL